TVLPSRPRTVSNASATAFPGTATSTASASDTSPPSLPILVTLCPARSQRSASPPPTFPLPTTATFIPRSFRRREAQTAGSGEYSAAAARLSFPSHGAGVSHRSGARRRHADRPARLARSRRPAGDVGEARVPEPRRLGQGPDRP